MAEISIIVPVYNVEKYLCRCLDSILAQTFTDWECILVDDGSTDNSGKICDEYATKDDRFRVLNKKNGGQGQARNMGIDLVLSEEKSKSIMFIDSDDFIAPDMLRILYTMMNGNETEISICNFEQTSNDTILSLNNNSVEILAIEDFYCKNGTLSVSPCCKLISTSILKNIRFPEIRSNEDEFFTYKVLFSTDRIAYTDSKLYGYFMSPNSTMRSEWSNNKMVVFDALREQEEFFRINGYTKAWYCVFKSVEWHTNYLLSLAKTPKNKKSVKKELKFFLDLYKAYYSIDQKPELYSLAYPIKSWLYWTYKGIFSKFHKK